MTVEFLFMTFRLCRAMVMGGGWWEGSGGEGAAKRGKAARFFSGVTGGRVIDGVDAGSFLLLVLLCSLGCY